MRGNVVVVPFPFSDLSATKKRPALILIDSGRKDLVLAAISSKSTDINGIALSSEDFCQGGLPRNSVIRTSTLFTCDRAKIIRIAGSLSSTKHKEVVEKLVALLN